MTLDVRSILLTSTAVALILTVMMLYYWKTRKVYAGFTQWVWGDIFITLGFFLLALRDYIPDYVSIIIGNMSIVLALVILHQGIRSFFGNETQDKFHLSLLLLFGLVFHYLLFTDENVAIRVIISSFTISFLMYRSGYLLLFKAPEKLKKSAAPGGVMMWITGAFFFVRAIDAIVLFNTYDLFVSRWTNVLSYVMGAVLVAAWTFGFFFLNSTRLELELEAARDEMETLIITDYLTGIHNRRYFFERAQQEFQRARRYEGSFSMLVIDADRFKNVNDRYGHAAGDKALKVTASVVSGSMRTSDTCARLGGEEFGVLLLETDLDKAKDTAERIRSQMEWTSISFDGQQFNITLSLGVAVMESGDLSVTDVLHRADQALYRAKEKGRNCVSE